MTDRAMDLGDLITEVADERAWEKRLKALKAKFEEILHQTTEWGAVLYVSEALKGVKEIKAVTEDAARLKAIEVYDGESKPHEGIYRMEQSIAFTYFHGDAIKYAIEHSLGHLLGLDSRAFNAFLRTAYNAENEDLAFVSEEVVTKAKLKGDLSEFETKIETPDLDAV